MGKNAGKKRRSARVYQNEASGGKNDRFEKKPVAKAEIRRLGYFLVWKGTRN